MMNKYEIIMNLVYDCEHLKVMAKNADYGNQQLDLQAVAANIETIVESLVTFPDDYVEDYESAYPGGK